MKFTVEVDDKVIRDILGRANVSWARSAEWLDQAKMVLRVVEAEPDKGSDGVYKITSAQFARGLAVMATHKDGAHHFRNLVTGESDMYTGDAVIQFAAFGEMKYG